MGMGFPMAGRKLAMSDWEGLVATVGHRVDPWQGRFMSSAAMAFFFFWLLPLSFLLGRCWRQKVISPGQMEGSVPSQRSWGPGGFKL